jgi:1,4-alpha-glucan branching enzyme
MIKKEYLKTKPECKVTFRLSKKLAEGAEKISLVGDFNKWNPNKTLMKKLKSGEFTAVVNLKKNNEYQFRYILNGNNWKNDDKADKYVPNNIDGDNSVVIV